MEWRMKDEFIIRAFSSDLSKVSYPLWRISLLVLLFHLISSMPPVWRYFTPFFRKWIHTISSDILRLSCSSLLRSGVSELDVADYQRSQLSVIYLVFEREWLWILVCLYWTNARRVSARFAIIATSFGIQLKRIIHWKSFMSRPHHSQEARP